MAKAKTLRFSEIVIEVVTAAGPPKVYTKPCGFRTKGFNRTASANETLVPDCDDEEAPAWVERDIESLSSEISGSGVLDRDNIKFWDEWLESGESREVRITIPASGAMDARSYVGDFKLTTLNWGAERGQRVTNEATLQSDGPVVSADDA